MTWRRIWNLLQTGNLLPQMHQPINFYAQGKSDTPSLMKISNRHVAWQWWYLFPQCRRNLHKTTWRRYGAQQQSSIAVWQDDDCPVWNLSCFQTAQTERNGQNQKFKSSLPPTRAHDNYLKNVWCSSAIFHKRLASRWLRSLKPIVLSNCSNWNDTQKTQASVRFTCSIAQTVITRTWQSKSHKRNKSNFCTCNVNRLSTGFKHSQMLWGRDETSLSLLFQIVKP